MTTTDEPTIAMKTLRSWLEEGRSVTILDIRKSADRAEWAIPGSLHIDAYDAIKAGAPDALAGVELPAGIPVVTVCGAGITAAKAAEHLRMRGITAQALEGGMQAWSLAWNTAEVQLPSSPARVIQVRRTGKGCLSYIVGGAGEAAVIDASVEPEAYVTLGRRYGWTITAVMDTHIHADHLSRSRALAEITGATLFMPAQDRVSYPCVPLHDNDEITFGGVTLKALATPGHTRESTCYLLGTVALFTGDTLFLAAVGRPDLGASHAGAHEQAQTLYRSLQRLQRIAPATRVLPGHTSEPIAFDDQPIVAPVGDVLAGLPLLHMTEATFVETLLARIPATPPNHEQIIAFNETGAYPAGDPTTLEAGANRCAVA